MSVWLELDDDAIATQTLQQAAALFTAAEQRLTRFSATSELSQLNANPGQWHVASNVLWSVVEQAIQLAAQTNGRFDPTLHNALVAAGYDRPFTHLTAAHNAKTAMARPKSSNGGAHNHRSFQSTHQDCHGHWQTVELDRARHAIRTQDGAQLDLGGIGKGYTAQQAVHFLSHWGPCLVDAGGDLAAGDAPSSLPGWPVAIAAPMTGTQETERDLAQLWLKNGALATSGSDYRHWQQDGRTMHHLIDPTTGQPAQSDLLTVSVLASDAAVAEAWAKALWLVGSVKATQEMTQKGIAAALVDHAQQLTIAPALQPFVVESH